MVDKNSTFPSGWPGKLPIPGQQFRFVPREVTAAAQGLTTHTGCQVRDVELESEKALIHRGLPAEFIFEPANIRLINSKKVALASETLKQAVLYEEVNVRIEECAGKDCSWCDKTDPSSINACHIQDANAPCCNGLPSLKGACGSQQNMACPIRREFCPDFFQSANGQPFKLSNTRFLVCAQSLGSVCKQEKNENFSCECLSQLLGSCTFSSACIKNYICDQATGGCNLSACKGTSLLASEDSWQELEVF